MMVGVGSRGAPACGVSKVHSIATLLGVSCLVLNPFVIVTASAQTAPPMVRSVAPGQRPAEAPVNRPAPAPDADAGSRSVAARARMNECGHQWNNMKHAGTASGTWKEFSRGCLAQK